MSKMLLSFIILPLLFFSCVNNPYDNFDRSIKFRIYIKPPARIDNKRATKYDKIAVTFYCSNVFSDTINVDYPNMSVTASFNNIVSNDSSYAVFYAMSSEGMITHYGMVNIGEYIKNEIYVIPVILKPICGSVILQFTNMPDSTDSIFANLKTDTITMSQKVKYAAFDIISFDYIPDSTNAFLSITGLSELKDTIFFDTVSFLYTVSQPAVFFLDGMGIDIVNNITIENPNNIFIGITDNNMKFEKESGGLLITEIFYSSVGDSDFIEIYNMTNDTNFSFELGIVSNSSVNVKEFRNITIRKNSFYVIGDSDCPSSWCDTNITLDLPTTNRWIYLKSLKDSTLFDWVGYSGENDYWPKSIKNKSVVLDSSLYDCINNDFGSNWYHCLKTIGDSVFISPHQK